MKRALAIGLAVSWSFTLSAQQSATTQQSQTVQMQCRDMTTTGAYLAPGEVLINGKGCRPVSTNAAQPTEATSVEQPKAQPAVTTTSSTTPKAETPPADIESVAPAEAEEYLRALIPAAKKFVSIDPFVFSTNVKDVNLGVSCSSRSSGATKGTVDDDGNVNAETTTRGRTDCSEEHDFYYTMTVALSDTADPHAVYLITSRCTVKNPWNHCQMPPEHTVYPAVLEEEKHGAFDIYAATLQKLGGKTKVAKFEVIGVAHMKLPDAH